MEPRRSYLSWRGTTVLLVLTAAVTWWLVVYVSHHPLPENCRYVGKYVQCSTPESTAPEPRDSDYTGVPTVAIPWATTAF